MRKAQLKHLGGEVKAVTAENLFGKEWFGLVFTYGEDEPIPIDPFSLLTFGYMVTGCVCWFAKESKRDEYHRWLGH